MASEYKHGGPRKSFFQMRFPCGQDSGAREFSRVLAVWEIRAANEFAELAAALAQLARAASGAGFQRGIEVAVPLVRSECVLVVSQHRADAIVVEKFR